ncbi:HAL/PAL/TAL family ammonia-lyase [Azospirillum brasilense]|uniref:HAL/PAL/TAL family ammonia-lyase n=1 Tax=Azospirillum brasilense TaxID=192 RepID=UPI000E0BDF08|nr:aromatic amino acid ammonia-lyase [Azospirillum brasilense]
MPTPRDVHEITLDDYDLPTLCRLARSDTPLALGADVAAAIGRCADFVGAAAYSDDMIYGVNTGFGALCEVRIQPEDIGNLQVKHVLSHACGVGDPLPVPLARLVMLIKLLTFRSGHTGIGLATVQRLLDFWNHGLTPAIPIRGTVGASGDLAPLSHMALPLLGLGSFLVEGTKVPAREVLDRHGWAPLNLGPKEGLALTNGVQFINAIAADCTVRLAALARVADVAAALSVQAFSCSQSFYQDIYHRTSRHPERRQVAANLRLLLEGSNHHQRAGANRSKQDPYSFRCVPQVHGAARQLLRFAEGVITNEVNGVSDNPLFFPESGEIHFGGNLHGQSTAFCLDLMAMAATELSSISERRTYQLLSGTRGLPPFLVSAYGANSGLMIVQYTAAALVNENKVLSTPASVDTIMTCHLQEDSVSMGGTSAIKLLQVVENLETVLAIELLAAAQASELGSDIAPSAATAALLAEIRGAVPFLDEDRILSEDILRVAALVRRRAEAWRDDHGLA